MIKIQLLRFIAWLAFVIATFSLLLMPESSLCIYSYIPDTVSHFSEFSGGMSKDLDMFYISSIIGLLFILPLLLAYRWMYFLLLLMVYQMIQWFFLGMIESGSIIGIVLDSFNYCQNVLILVWAVGKVLFLILSGVFIICDFKQYS